MAQLHALSLRRKPSLEAGAISGRFYAQPPMRPEGVTVSDVATNNTSVDGVAGRYASALFDLAKESSKLTEVEGDLVKIQDLLKESPDLVRLVRSPVISSSDQSRALSAVLEKGGISGLASNFLLLLARNRRLFAVEDIIKVYRSLAAKARGEVSAEVSSAVALSEAQLAELKEALRASVGKDVTLDTRVDPSLLGGLVVKLGSRMIDSSLKTKLQNMKAALNETSA